MKASVEVLLAFLLVLVHFGIATFLIFVGLSIGLILGRGSLSRLLFLNFLDHRHCFLVVGLLARELDDSAEPFPREDQLVPEPHPLHRVEVIEPEFVLLAIREQLTPHLLQVVEHAVILFLAPGTRFDRLELQWVLPVLGLSDLAHDAKVEQVVLHFLFNGALDLSDQQSHQV